MAELTISDLRNLETAESSLLFAVDGDTETFNLTLNTLYEYTKERLGFLETGSVEMYMGEVVPDTHTEIDGKTFDPLIFPKMGALFPSGILPDMRGMMLKHAPDGRAVLSFEGEAVKSHTHTASQAAHNHTMNHDHPNTTTSNNGGHTHSLNMVTSGDNGGVSSSVSVRTTSNTGTTRTMSGNNKANSNGSHTHTLNVPNYSGDTGNATPVVTVNASGSAKNLVDNIAVKFIIKKA